MEQQEYDELLRRLAAVSERQDDRQADMQSLLRSLSITSQRLDGSLTFVDEAMETQTTILAQQQTLLAEQKTLLAQHTALLTRITLVLERHEATFERLGRLLDERLPPSGNGR